MLRIAAPLAERGNDCYQTPEVATRALMAAETLPRKIWEPACGPGAIVRVLRAAGHTVVASDLIAYPTPFQDFAGRDFLLERAAPDGVEAIVTNPPYKLAGEFAEHALQLAPVVALLLRLQFLEAERRTSILEGGRLARVHVFRNRLPMMHRDGWTGARARNASAHAWFIWLRDHRGPTELRRISWSEPAGP